MIVRPVAIVLLAGAHCLVASAVDARETTLTRKEIRQMPILERPSRPGHFYGNAVRRGSYRGAQHSAPQSPLGQQDTLVPQPNPGYEN
jgi:hypothetical protein